MNSSLVKTKLKDVCKIEKGKIGITKAIEGEYPLVVTAEERSNHNEWHFDEPATIVPLVSSTGHGHASIKRLHYAEGKYAVGNILATLIPKDHKYLNAKYLYVYLTINKEELLVSQMTGAANVSLTLTRLAEVEIEIPDYETQLKVIKKYEDAQRYKNSMNSQIETRSELLEKFRQQILQDAITGKLSEKWRKENQNIESAKMLLEKIKAEKEKLVKEGKIKKQKPLPPIKENEIPFELPEGWAWCRLDNITINCDADRKPVSRSDREYKEKVFDYYGASGVIDKIDGFTHEGRFLLIGEDGANLVTRSTPIAFIAEGKFWVNNHAHVLRTLNEVTLQYLLYHLNAISLENYITGGFQPKLSQSNLGRINIHLPPLAEQQYIVSCIESLFAKLDHMKELNIGNQKNIDLLNQVVLKEMFKG